ncbi:MAG: preprotein translocase subunit SecE [Candidatus Omnitrophota bacterium]
MIGKIKKFFSEVVVELKKVSWSTRQEVLDATWLILASSAILGVFIASIDFLLARFVALFIR